MICSARLFEFRTDRWKFSPKPNSNGCSNPNEDLIDRSCGKIRYFSHSPVNWSLHSPTPFFKFVHTLFGAQDLWIRFCIREKREEQREQCWAIFYAVSSFLYLPATLKMLYNFSVALLSSLFAAYLSCQFQPFFCRIDYRFSDFSSTMLCLRWIPV